MSISVQIFIGIAAFFAGLFLNLPLIDVLLLPFIAQIAAAILHFIFSEAIEKSYSLKSFLKNLSLNVVGVIFGIAVLLGGLWLGLKILELGLKAVLVVLQYVVFSCPFLVLFGIIVLWLKGIDDMPPEKREKWLEDLSRESREEQEREEKQREIDELERERSYIKRSNNILDDLTGSGLSKSELRQNQKLYNKMGREIQDKRRELND